MKKENRFPRVALLIQSSRSYGRGVLHGIAGYIRDHGPWATYFDYRSAGNELPDWIRHWKGEGILFRLENPELGKALRKKRIPLIDLRGDPVLSDVPQIRSDEAKVARLAAEHFLDRQFFRFAYCGFPGTFFSDCRGSQFTQLVAARGLPCEVYQPPEMLRINNSEERERFFLKFQDHLSSWLAKLPKPIALLACNDVRGQEVLSACREKRIRVPDEIAVLGVDNDEVLCDFADPPLSSIMQNTFRIGYLAAETLDEMMRSGRQSHDRLLVPPVGIVTRRSTEITAVEDPDVAAALKYIWEHARTGVTVQEVLKKVPMSLRLLQARFRAAVGRSPKDQILTMRVQCLQEYLAITNLPMWKIAELTGFKHVGHMNALFKRVTGKTPREYRGETLTHSPREPQTPASTAHQNL